MVKPGGTGRPALVISATPAPLPPSRSRIFALPSLNKYTHLRGDWLTASSNPVRVICCVTKILPSQSFLDVLLQYNASGPAQNAARGLNVLPGLLGADYLVRLLRRRFGVEGFGMKRREDRHILLHLRRRAHRCAQRAQIVIVHRAPSLTEQVDRLRGLLYGLITIIGAGEMAAQRQFQTGGGEILRGLCVQAERALNIAVRPSLLVFFLFLAAIRRCISSMRGCWGCWGCCMIRPGNHRVWRARPMEQELLQFFLSALVGVGRAIAHIHVRHHVYPLLSCLLSSLILFLIVPGVNREV